MEYIRVIAKFVRCWFLTGHVGGTGHFYTLPSGRRRVARECVYCGWIMTEDF